MIVLGLGSCFLAISVLAAVAILESFAASRVAPSLRVL